VPGGGETGEFGANIVAPSIDYARCEDRYPFDTMRQSLEARPMWNYVCKHPSKKPKRPVNAEMYDETYS